MTVTASGRTPTRRRKSFNQSNQSQLKFRPSGSSAEAHHGRGTRPLPEPMAVHDFIQMIVVHGCKKVLLVDHRLKIAVYLGLTFVLSIFADAFNFPRSYFSNPRNALNAMFVGFGWGWTLVVAGAFVVVTGLVRSCGDRRRVALYHLTRLVVGTAMWWFWTSAFAAIEHKTGLCTVTGQYSKRACRDAGGKWRSFDISGHTFLLIFCNLLLMEEARAILGWDGIKDAIRREEYNRLESNSAVSVFQSTTQTTSTVKAPGLTQTSTATATTVASSKTEFVQEDETYLKDLTDAQFCELKYYYSRLVLVGRALFVAMTLLSLVYDALLLATVLYFHVMTEKLLAAGIAVAAWFFTYRVWFKAAPFPLSPDAGAAFRCESGGRGRGGAARPGGGGLPLNRRRPVGGDEHAAHSGGVATFLGMPLRRFEVIKTDAMVASSETALNY